MGGELDWLQRADVRHEQDEQGNRPRGKSYGAAAPIVGDGRPAVTIPHGRKFWKMSGSGNDFLFFDARDEPAGVLADPAVVDRICARATGVGADGIVFLQHDATEQLRIRYLNRDGSLGELCGNA